MNTIETIDPIIEAKLELCKSDRSHLKSLFGEYAAMCATGNRQMIEHYREQLKTICLSDVNKDPKVIAIGILSEALADYYYANFQKVITPCIQVIEMLCPTTFNDLVGLSHFILGSASRSLGEIDTAVQHLLQGTEKISPDGELVVYHCFCYYQLADINIEIKDFSSAENYYANVVPIAEKLGNSSVLFRTYNGIANLNLSIKNFNKCKEYHDLSLAIKGLSDAEKGRGYCDLGVYFYEISDYKKAIAHLNISYEIRLNSGLLNAVSTTLLNLGKTQLASKDLLKAQFSLEEALKICKKFKSKSKLLICHELLAETYSELENWKKSAQSFQKYKALTDELSSKQLQKIYKLKNDQINKHKAIIEETHKEITDSIRYAKRLQDAILPSFDEINCNIPNSFIYFEPKDQVSGDFYWFEPLNGYNYLAVADCTGHGVPGAMLSIVCSNALNRAVKEFNIIEPSNILNKTRELVIETFTKSGEAVSDGMDISLCAFKGNKLVYSGANIPLWIVRKTASLSQEQKMQKGNVIEDDYSLIEYKGDRQPIGLHSKMQDFTQKEIDLFKGDNIYLFSDGFADQFGGEKGKKFRYKPFKELLLKSHAKSMEEQSLIIATTFKNWKGKLDQVDDVCVLGVKIT